MKNIDDILIEELDLSIRSKWILEYKKIKTLGELRKLTYNDLTKIRNMSKKPLKEIIEKASDYGITFKVEDKIN